MPNSIPLVHVWDNQKITQRCGLFPIGDGSEIPKAWELPPAEYEPKALPTPFARAEATRLLLGRIEEATAHPLVSEFRWLLLGIAAGILNVEPLDLASPAFDNLGRALQKVGGDVRYFGRIVWTERNLAYGATYPSCLAWSHSRLSQGDWNALAQAVQAVQTHALTVLADWRESMRASGRWNRERVPWQRGVDHVLGETQPSANSGEFHEDACSVGPVLLDLPNPDESTISAEPVYLPAYSRDFAGVFMQLCNFQPQSMPGAVEFRDGQGKPIGRIRMPAAGAEVDPLLVGIGTLETIDRASPRVPLAEQKLWVRGKGGLVEQLRSVDLALTQRGRAVTSAAVRATPFLYPDPIRILFQRGYWPDASPGVGNERLTGRAELILASRGVPLPARSQVEAAGGAIAALGTEAAPVQIAFLDHVNGLDVLDLRALGFVLFRVFVREAEVASDGRGNIEDAETLVPLLVHSLEHPLEPHDDVYKLVAAPSGPDMRKRLATLQRLVATYAASVDRGAARVLDRACRSFATWAHGGPVEALGRTSSNETDFVPFRLPTGLELRLARDPIHAHLEPR